MAGRRIFGKKLNNSGAALVTVIVVIAFISILVTVVLYMAGMNYFMKSTDKRIKNSFYDAETGMERIRAELMVEAKKAYQPAYQETVKEFLAGDGAAREALYNETFVETLKDNFNTYITASGSLEAYLQGIAGTEYAGGLTVNSTALELHKAEGYVVIKNVKLEYTKDGYTTVIETDFLVKAPDMDWQTETTSTAWDASDTNADASIAAQLQTKALERKEFEMSDCVIYYNWKKE
ncbi:MAG: hypothetical protein J6C84_07265 [Lachnospiraceae bacterium]|nr:hypothetical protein [Lachnospiraceae bacterium]